jgi:putative endonuclease
MKQYFVYIMTNQYHNVLYTGFTDHVFRRSYEHAEKIFDGFTKKYNVNKLVYYEVFHDSAGAIKREREIKNLLRKKKIELINTKNPEYKDLRKEILSWSMPLQD